MTIFTTNILLQNEFIYFLDHMVEQDVNAIKQEIDQEVVLSPTITFELEQKLSNFASLGYITQIKKGEILIYDGFLKNKQHIQTLKSKFQDQEKEVLRYFDSEYALYEGELQLETDVEILIYAYRPTFINQQGLHHFSSLNRIFIYVGVITLILALLASYIVSKLLVRPLYSLINQVEVLRNGGKLASELKNNHIQEYHRLLIEFNHLNDALESQKTARKNLSRDLSHELRTPLTAMILMFEGIQENVLEFNDEILYSLIEEAQRMKTLIDDIHQLEQIESSSYDFVPQKIYLEDTIQQSVTLFHHLLLEKEMQVFFDFKQKIGFLDKKRFSQIINNLISNAIKYSPPQTSIFIRTFAKDTNLFVQIRDQGMGVPDSEKENIFKRYYRADATNEEGSGIGLAVVSELVKAQNGTISIFDGDDKVGSIFEIEFKENLH